MAPVLLSKEKLITEERFVVNVKRSPQREREWILFYEDYPEQTEVFRGQGLTLDISINILSNDIKTLID
jgi:hypothetical protein